MGKTALRRVAILIAGVLYLTAVSVFGAADWMLNHPTPENLRRAVGWFPGNSSLWSAYARRRFGLMEDSTLPEVINAYQQALARDPFDLASWDGLATAYDRRRDFTNAEAALRAAVFAVPSSPTAAWRLANFLLVRDRASEALPLLRIVAAADPGLRPAVFDLGLKLLTEPKRVFAEVVPEIPETRREYFKFLVWNRRLFSEAFPIWKIVALDRSEETLRMGSQYVEELAIHGLGEQALAVWKEIVSQPEAGSSQPAPGRMTNGDFETSLRNAGLDWRIEKGAGYQIGLDNFVYQSGTRSLRVQFDGTANLDFIAVRQWILVEPGREYRLQAYLKTENISTDNGMYLAVVTQGAPAAESWEQDSEVRIGTSPWTEEHVDFRTGPGTHVVQIYLRRLQSAKLNNLIQGTAWLDNVSLQTLPN